MNLNRFHVGDEVIINLPAEAAFHGGKTTDGKPIHAEHVNGQKGVIIAACPLNGELQYTIEIKGYHPFKFFGRDLVPSVLAPDGSIAASTVDGVNFAIGDEVVWVGHKNTDPVRKIVSFDTPGYVRLSAFTSEDGTQGDAGFEMPLTQLFHAEAKKEV